MLSKYSKIVLAAAAVLLFGCGYHICSLVYDPCFEVEKWFDLRFNIYAVVMLLCFLLAVPAEGSKALRFVLCIGIGISTSDVLDRVFFDITTFTKEDIVMVTATVVIAYLEVYTQILKRLKIYGNRNRKAV